MPEPTPGSRPWRGGHSDERRRPGEPGQGITGDRKQRYEVSYWDIRYQKRRLLGRTDELEHAEALSLQIARSRWYDLPEIRDREEMHRPPFGGSWGDEDEEEDG